MKRLLLAAGWALFSLQWAAAAAPPVRLGIDVLKKQNYQLLQGKRVGLIANHTGLDSDGNSTIDLLHRAPGVKLVALFSPEHGIRGSADHGVKISDGKDERTGLPVFSLYGKTQRPTDDMLAGVDMLVYDIQDIGTRFYTYTTTLAYALEEAARRDIEFVVLDRPNPITGAIAEGEPLDPRVKHFTAYLNIPVRHALTAGEIAIFHNETTKLNARLYVVKMEGWARGMWMDDAGHKFRPTSPNMRTLKAAMLYPGVGSLECTNVAVGRGTKTPFELLGAPWMDGKAVAEKLKFLDLPGLQIRAARFKPTRDLYQGQTCSGIRIEVADRDAARPHDLFVHLMLILLEQHRDQFKVRWNEMERVWGSGRLKEMIDQGQTTEAILEVTHQKAAAFQDAVQPYLLYK